MARTVVTLAVIVALQWSALAFDTKWHADATRAAMDQNGFSADARLLCQFTNYLTDYFSGADLKEHLNRGLPDNQGVEPADVARLHFDALTTHAQVERQWQTLEANTTSELTRWAKDPSVKAGYRPVVLMTVLGASLHAVQDFYSHSNWLRKVRPVEGFAPIWFEVAPADRAKLDIMTGWYPDGNKTGVLYHHEENKDSTGRPLNAQAFETATRASVDWVRRIIAATPDVPWAALKTWKAEPANLNGFWLRKADATFITTTSTVMGHWDGSTPAKNVFAPEADRNNRMAKEALGLTMSVYSQNLVTSGGHTITPHWVGFTLYHVERGLTKGLSWQNVIR